MEDKEREGGLLAAPPRPTEYRRMLSWQLSQLQSAPVTNARGREREKRKRRKRSSNGAGEVESGGCSDAKEGEDHVDEGGCGEEGGFVYLVVNSDGEEECYYSAPESPLGSEDDGGGGEEEGGGGEEVCLPPQERKRGGRSKKGKKKVRRVARLAEVEFFGPLCDLVEGSLEVDVGGLEISDRVEVPSLAELCVRSIHTARLRLRSSSGPESEEEQLHLPYLIHALVGAHRAQRSLVGLQVRWLERFLAAWETESADPRRTSSSAISNNLSPPLAFCPRCLWDSQSVTETPDPLMGLHLPLPFVSPTSTFLSGSLGGRYVRDRNMLDCLEFGRHVSFLLHFANFLYPLFTLRGGAPGHYQSDTDITLSPSQTAAIRHVSNFLSSRYKVLCKDHSEMLKLSPGYVYWARGQVKLALSAFSTALDSLKYAIDRAITLNEMGRMMLMFGDRYKAALFFTKSQEAEPPTNEFEFFKPEKEAVQPHVLTLQASAWDTGLLTAGVARQAAHTWSQVLHCSSDLPVGSWYLPLAAVESRMMVHCGVPVGSDPSTPLTPTTGGECQRSQWLWELLDLLQSLTTSHPILYYHHSLLLAMAARHDDARKTFLRFCDNSLLFRDWAEGSGFPGDPFSTLTNRRLLNPWLPLCNMLVEQGLTHAPVMKLKWRTRLLYPMYPYSKTEEVNYLSDHCSSAVNLRLSDSGHITADLHMDLPPMRSVLLDPYSGCVCFSRSASLHHHLSGPVDHKGHGRHDFITHDETAMPWPLRLLEPGDGVAVDLVMSGCVDPELDSHMTNQLAVLHWYSDSQHSQLDLRLAIRRELKKAVLEVIQGSIQQAEQKEKDLLADMKEHDLNAERTLKALQEEKEEHAKRAELVDSMMQRGLSYSVEDVYSGPLKVPSKYNVTKGTGKQYKRYMVPGGEKRRRERNRSVKEFNLTLTEYFVFGEASLALFFTVKPLIRDDHSEKQFYRQVLVVINCSSQESFLQPGIHCAGDTSGFVDVYPSNEAASVYPSRHLPHIRHLTMLKYTKKLGRLSQLLLDQDGQVVYQRDHHNITSSNHNRRGFIVPGNIDELEFSMGHRVFLWGSARHPSSDVEVSSYNLEMKDHMRADPSVTNRDPVMTVVPVPGCLLVHTVTGLILLHPGSLKLVRLDHPKQLDEEANQSPYEHHFLARSAKLSVISVFNVEGYERGPYPAGGDLGEGEGGEGEEEGEKGEQSEERREELGRLDFGACCVALTLNSRLLVLQIPHKSEVVGVLIDMVMPGMVTEFHDMGGLGFTVSVTQFPDSFREELYWLSPSGKLRGMLPCLGPGRHSFLSVTLPPPPPSSQREEEEGEGEDEEGGQCLFFNDGQGGVCCIQLDS